MLKNYDTTERFLIGVALVTIVVFVIGIVVVVLVTT